MNKGNSKRDFSTASKTIVVGLGEALRQLLGGLAWRWTPPCECFFFHLLHPVLSAFAGVLMPDVVSRVGERHSTYSALHVHLPLIHLPGSTICISLPSWHAKNTNRRRLFASSSITHASSQMEEKKTKNFLIA